MTGRLIRPFLGLGLLLVCALLVVAHGLRGLAVAAALLLVVWLAGTPPFRIVERALVRLTGSRSRAAALVMAILIGAALAVNLYDFVR